MGLVIGNASTFGASAFVLNGGRIIFRPSSAAVTGDTYVLSDRDVEFILDATGHFEVNLISTATTLPATSYDVLLDSVGPTGKRRHRALLPGKLRVPPGPGPFNFAEIFATSANPALVWVDIGYPNNITPVLGAKRLEVDPADPYYGWLKEWR